MGILLLSCSVNAQTTRIYGSVSNANSGEMLPFANVVFKGSKVGTITDSAGSFVLETKRKFDSLQVSVLGFHTQMLVVANGVTEEIDIQLWPESFKLGMVTVRPGENPAFRVLRNVIKNKKKNSPENLDSYQYQAYHQVRFDLNNFTGKIKKNLILKPFHYIWENTDTTENGVNYLPILLTESSERHYHQKQPRVNKEEVLGRRTFKFFKAPKIMDFVQDMYIDPNIYDNYMFILDRGFPSPINDHYKRNYRFVLLDSLVHINGNSCYHIGFKPKGKSDVAFTGSMFIDDSSYAVVQVDLEFSIEANINFVRNYWVQQNFSFVQDKQWFLTSSKVIGDFTIIENAKEMTGFFGNKTTKIDRIQINQPISEGAFSKIDPVIFVDSAFERSETFWRNVRKDTFSVDEKKLVEMVDRMNSDPSWKRFIAATKLVSEGYLPLGKVDLGDVFSFFSYNKIEGARVKLGLRTNEKFSKDFFLSGYGAYGFKDKRFKGGGKAEAIFARNRSKKMRIGVTYRNDLFQQGRSQNTLALDHMLTSLVRISGRVRRTLVENYSAYLERQWITGVSSRITAFRDGYESLSSGFLVADGVDTTSVLKFRSAGIKFNIRFAWGDTNLPATMVAERRGLFPSKYPMISFQFTSGFKGLWEGEFNYQHYKLKLEYQLKANKWGHLDILSEGGIINGNVPYPLLNVPNGNPLVFNDDNAFNLMNYMEFAADKYVSLQLEHHFDGVLFNRIPLIRKLKLRSFLLGKIYYGTLTQNNSSGKYVLGNGISSVNTPYAEVGFGIENILKISRIDCTWRLTHLDNSNVLNFVVKPSFYFKF